MRRAARTDGNHRHVVRILRSVGASVLDLSRVGQGCPDLAVGFRGVTYLLEVKDGSKPPSARQLTPDEAAWHADWRGHVAVVNTPDEALEAIGATI